MKIFFFLFFSFFLSHCWIFSHAPTQTQKSRPVLKIYTYASVLGEGSWGAFLKTAFEKTCACRIQWRSVGDAVTLLERLRLDQMRKHIHTDLVLGVDLFFFQALKPWVGSWNHWSPKHIEHLHPFLKPFLKQGFLPYDYGVMSWISNEVLRKKRHLPLPNSIQTLLDPRFKKQFLIQDPRFSSPGLGFLLWTQWMKKKHWLSFWSRFRKQVLLLAPNWGQSYGLFLKNQAPFVWSYTTSEAYHRIQGKDKKAPFKYRAILFKEGNPLQIEGAFWIQPKAFASSPPTHLAQSPSPLVKRFLSFLISKKAQNALPTHNWMYPARKDIPLPKAFKKLPKPTRFFSTKKSVTPLLLDTLLKKWLQEIK